MVSPHLPAWAAMTVCHTLASLLYTSSNCLELVHSITIKIHAVTLQLTPQGGQHLQVGPCVLAGPVSASWAHGAPAALPAWLPWQHAPLYSSHSGLTQATQQGLQTCTICSSPPVWLSNMWQPVLISKGMLRSVLHKTSCLALCACQPIWPLQESWITQEINLTAAAAAIMSRMPIANQAAFQVGLVVRPAAVQPPCLLGRTDPCHVGGRRLMLSGATSGTCRN